MFRVFSPDRQTDASLLEQQLSFKVPSKSPQLPLSKTSSFKKI